MKYAIIGMGAVGGYYGSRLAKHGHDVHFLVRSDFAHVREHGLSVDSYLGSYHLHNLNVYDDVSTMPKCDVVLVCLKTTANQQLAWLLPPLLKPTTIVVLVQNGIGVESDVQCMFPRLQLAAGVAFINCAKSGAGSLVHHKYGSITLCDYSCSSPQVLHAVAADFCSSQVPAQVADFVETRWRKNILNMATNGVTVMLNARCDQLMAHPSSCQLVRDLMSEGVRAAQACGASTIHYDLVDQLAESTSQTVFATSMKYDYDHNLPMEIEYMYTRPILEAERLGCHLPLLRMLEQQLRYFDSYREAK